MKFEAIYDHGRLEFNEPVQFKHDRVRLVVVVADEDIEATESQYNLSREVIDMAKQMRGRLNTIRNAPLPPYDELSHVLEKSMERMDAFALREDGKLSWIY